MGLSGDPEREHQRVDAIEFIDAVNGAATLDAHMEAVKQVAVADRIVLTKTDLLQLSGAKPSLLSRLAALIRV